MKRILITGGLGYVGGRIALYLKERHPEFDIHLTSRRSPPFPAWTDKFTVQPVDFKEFDSIRAAVGKAPYDAVIHLAALNEHECFENPENAYEINTRGTFWLAKSCHEMGVRHLIYFSTFHVYGVLCPGTLITEQSPTFPSHPYATTHRAAEDILAYFRQYHNLKTLVFRLSNSFGTPADATVNRWTLVFNDLCRQAVTTGKMIIRSSGKQHRDFISLTDVTRAVDFFLTEQNQGRSSDGLYNLGGNHSMSIIEVARRIAASYAERYKGTRQAEIITGPDDGIIQEPVRFCIDKLLATGFLLIGELDNEITRTLALCEESGGLTTKY